MRVWPDMVPKYGPNSDPENRGQKLGTLPSKRCFLSVVFLYDMHNVFFTRCRHTSHCLGGVAGGWRGVVVMGWEMGGFVKVSRDVFGVVGCVGAQV